MEIELSNKKTVSPVIVVAVLASCLASFLFQNGMYLFICLATLYLIIFLLWKSNRPGGVVFAFIMQWTQVFAFVIWRNSNGTGMNLHSPHSGTAVTFACLGLVLMAFIFSRRINALPAVRHSDFVAAAASINEKKIFVLYLFSTLFLASAGFALGASGGGLAQILITFGSVKWLFFLMYGYVAWINKKNRWLLVGMILFEFSSGLFSYFSTFKEGIFFAIMLSLTFIRKVTFKQVVWGTLIALVVGAIFLTWTAIKNDYRSYISGGQRQQVVTVSRSEALSKMGAQVSELSWARYELAINAFLYRLQYVLHLALTMDRVPDVIPHQHGAVWWDNISFVLMPRILFPQKGVYEATIKTNMYTGLQYAGYKQGSAFSLGYFADSYIDFGYIGMFIPLALIALYITFSYRTFFKMKNLNLFMRFGLINIVMHEFMTFEADGLYLFGRQTLMLLFFWTLSKTVLPRIQYWLYK
jgi:hypothetical protein